MAIDFPTGPAVNDLYTYNSVTYKWDGVFWSPQLIGAISSFLIDDAINTAVTNFTFTHTTTLTPGTGIGTGISLGAETSSGNVEIGAIIKAITTDVVGATEDFDLTFSVMDAGAAASEKMRITSDGQILINQITGVGYGQVELSADGNLVYNLAMFGINNVEVGAGLAFAHTRGATAATHTIVQNNDVIGYMYALGSDGTSYNVAANIHFAVDGTPGVGDMPGRIVFMTASDGSSTAVERLRINQAGQVNIGPSGSYNTLYDFITQFGLSGPSSAISVNRYANIAGGPFIIFAKSRSSTVGGHTVVQDGDQLGGFFFGGSDGTNFAEGAWIDVRVDGTPGNDDMPTRMLFGTTPDGAATGVERLRIDSAGRVGIGMTPLAFTDPRPFQVSITGSTSGSQAGVVSYLSSGSGTVYNLGFMVSNWNPDGYGDGFSCSYARGTQASPVIVNSTDLVGGLLFAGYDGAAYRNIAKVLGFMDGAPAAGDMPGRLEFHTTADGAASPGEKMRINNAGYIIVGYTGNISGGKINVAVDASIDANFAGYVYNSNIYGAGLQFFKTRGADVASHTTVQADDNILYMTGFASDGTAYRGLSDIRYHVDGTPGSNDMPGRITFYTRSSGAAAPLAERLRITNGGHIIARSTTTSPPTLANNGDWVMTPTSNTQMRISYRGSDGTTRVGNITLA